MNAVSKDLGYRKFSKQKAWFLQQMVGDKKEEEIKTRVDKLL